MYLKRPDNFSEMLDELSAINNNINQIIFIAKTQSWISQTDIATIENMKAKIWLKIKNL